ncbi:hypothetical protein VNO77_16807 [Canavalia gladiata]|uniref:Spermidine hydroxycinnamoyl transferase n=1 Tax=Canavalia gladiata TaxID=3824 RepID=A0AAN9LI21_CANGL
MGIIIHNCNLVIPSETKPSSNLSLSLCDQIKIPTHGTQLYLYANTRITNHSSLTSIIHTLSTSLSKALTHYYPFAGRLCWTQNGRLQLLCNAKGALLLEATCNCELNLDDLAHFAPTHVVEQLAPKVDYDVPIEDIPLLLAQLTRFQCGSLTLGVVLCRPILDGTSAASFINSWAKLARGESLDSSLMPLLDRNMLDSRKLNKPPRFQHTEFFPPPIWKGRLREKQKLATAILELKKAQVEKLKKKACDFGKKQRAFTSFEVITGHLWRCVCKVRYVGNGNGDQPTRLLTLVNCRNRLSPSLPKAYFGNATFPTVTPTCSFDDIIHKPLGYAVEKLREAIERLNDEYVRSALDYIANVKDMNLLRDTFYNSSGKGQFMKGDPNLYMVAWTNLGLLDTDFGWGKPFCLLPGNINSEGKAFLMDNASGHGDGFILAICLQASHIDALNKLFYKDIETPSAKL